MPPAGRLRGCSALLMEPDVRSQLRLSGLLCQWEMSLHLADDLDEAFETLDELERIDFLLIDGAMPGDSACVTIQKMRERLGTDTVIIGLIPSQREDTREACLGQGADDSVSMPVDAHELSEVLNRHLPVSAE